jgi:mRNA interferase RelE/StbE
LAWRIEFDASARKEIERLDWPVAARIIRFLRERVTLADDPRSLAHTLKGERLGEFWKYRVGDYRVIARIEDQKLLILVIRIRHRSDFYK